MENAQKKKRTAQKRKRTEEASSNTSKIITTPPHAFTSSDEYRSHDLCNQSSLLVPCPNPPSAKCRHNEHGGQSSHAEKAERKRQYQRQYYANMTSDKKNKILQRQRQRRQSKKSIRVSPNTISLSNTNPIPQFQNVSALSYPLRDMPSSSNTLEARTYHPWHADKAERKRQRQRAYYANMSADRKIVLAAKQRERRQRKRASNVTEANEEQTPKIIKRTQISEEKELDETAEEPLTLPNVIEPNNTPSIDQFCCPNHLSSTDSAEQTSATQHLYVTTSADNEKKGMLAKRMLRWEEKRPSEVSSESDTPLHVVTSLKQSSNVETSDSARLCSFCPDSTRQEAYRISFLRPASTRQRTYRRCIRNPPQFPYVLPPAVSCRSCGAKLFHSEPPGFCCNNGQVRLAVNDPPHKLYHLFTTTNEDGRHFRRYIRAYNNMFSFTSYGVKADTDINKKSRGIYTFRVQGKMYHYINDLTPENNQPKHLQLYFYDTDHELENRLHNTENLRADIVKILMDVVSVNPYAAFFRTLKDIQVDNHSSIIIWKSPVVDQKTFNAPTASQVAAIWIEGDTSTTTCSTDIIVHGKSGGSHQILHYYGCYDPLQYPLLFPFGECGWHQGIERYEMNHHGATSNCPSTYANAKSSAHILQQEEKALQKKNGRTGISCRQYYCYMLQLRSHTSSILLRSARLLQQYVVDMYIKIESTRLDFFRKNQDVIRSDLYQGILDVVATGETKASTVGKRIVLPPSFIGGPRDMKRRYLDAMMLVQHYGKPDIFLTMTCNPSWPEIVQELAEGEEAQNRPDLVTRIFHAKLMQLKEEVVSKKLFGPVAAFVYVVEFQKRGLPHAHFLIILQSAHKIRSPEDYDKYVSAEIPDKDQNVHLHNAVKRHMIHGPCGSLNSKNVCMGPKGCKNKYPRQFSEYTTVTKSSYPIYRRRDNGRTVHVRGCELNNQWVVPYNAYLLAKFDCHINVEICSSIKAVKYLYKYIYKGHDKVLFQVISDDKVMAIDEISLYQSTRWISPPESTWRIFKFPLNDIAPPVLALALHLPNMQGIGFHQHDNLFHVVNNERSARTMLTEYFAVNRQQKEGPRYLYHEFPEHFVWDAQNHFWNPRKRGLSIGRIVSANPAEGERYYLRLLLLHVKGATSFESLKTVGDVRCSSFRHAAEMYGLLECDRSLEACLHEAATFQMPSALRRLFATILVHCEASNPRMLWEKFYDSLSEDFRCHENNDAKVMCTTLVAISHYLDSMGRKISDYDLPPIKQNDLSPLEVQKEIAEEKSIPIPAEDLLAADQLNSAQRTAYDIILECVRKKKPGAFFVDGPGGTGKTFLYRALLATVRSQGHIALAVATSGIAASNLPGGRTAHSRFKIPLDSDDSSTCNIGKQTGIAALIKEAQLVIWDEASMARKQSVEAFEAMLRDISSSETIFGGKVVVFGGDFRQVLPVTPKSTRQETITNSLVMSPLWKSLFKIYLTENMRALHDPHFSDFLLRVGEGREKYVIDDHIAIPDEMLIQPKINSNPIDDLSDVIFPNLQDHLNDPSQLEGRAILTPKNDHVDEINAILNCKFPGKEYTYNSFDRAIDDTNHHYQQEFLHTLTPNGLPPHRLCLKVHTPAILLRNLDPYSGLCNGTRVICKQFQKNVILAEIASGHHRGQTVFIPRIPLRPAANENYPFQFERKQFPIRLCFAMTINKAQGQTLRKVGIYLPQPVFSHGQLYVALSRAQRSADVKILIKAGPQKFNTQTHTRNVVYEELLSRTTPK